MRDDFQRWYEAVQLTLNPEVMETRLTAVQALAATVIDAELG
jgi:hypothetical protein